MRPIVFPKKHVPVLTSNSIPLIGVIVVDWEHVSGQFMVEEIKKGNSVLLRLGAERELERAEKETQFTLSDIGGVLIANPLEKFLIRINLDKFESIHEHLDELSDSGIEILPGISKDLHEKIVSNNNAFADSATLGIIEFYLNFYFDREKRLAVDRGVKVVDLIDG
ncbi:hypothetical protein IJH46_01850 [Candidatus Saccharibacteria bacterium]|nr:hypothetical protein [Candidatus Saccharibacteria bacterium]